MNVIFRSIVLLVLAKTLSWSSPLEWRELSGLPDPQGFAGVYSGFVDGTLVIAGGANFPAGRPWDGAEKIWSDKVYVLEGDVEEGTFDLIDFKLPRPLAYGLSIPWKDKLICVGGSDAQQHYADVFMIGRDDGSWTTESLAALPTPLSNHFGALLDSTLYVAGGTVSPTASETLGNVWGLDLRNPQASWVEIESWPGRPRMLAVAGVQDDSFFVMSGTDLVSRNGEPAVREYLTDAFRYSPLTGWKEIASLPRAAVAAPGPALAIGQAHLMIVGGDDGANATKNDILRDSHPGFPDDILAYHTITDTWTAMGSFPKDLGPDPEGRPNDGDWPPVTTPVVIAGDTFIIPSGEVRPGVRTPKVWMATLSKERESFGWLNFSVLFLYLGGMIAVGVYYNRRQHNADDYFRGGKRLPWWVAGLSIYATMLSSLTYMGVPAKAYATNWEYFIGYPIIFITSGLVVRFILPFFRAIDATSAYEYLELRFSHRVRQVGSALFLMFQVGRMAIVMFLSSLALNVITNLSVPQCIALMGCLSIVYCTLGGVEAVAWTDAIQSIVLIIGALLCLGIIVTTVDGGLSAIVATGREFGKFEMIHWDWDAGSFARTAVWVMILGAFGQNLVSYSSDQAVVQRYMTTPTQSAAAKSIWTNGLMAIPTGFLFFLLGTSLFAFYRNDPSLLDPTFNTDAVLPLFIARELPVGIAGIVVAGIFAAAQSTVSTSMNSIATSFVIDFVKPIRDFSDQTLLRYARVSTVIAGILGTGLALFFTLGTVKSVFDKFLAVLGLFGGALGGLFLLGMFTTRANARGAMAGILVGAVVTYIVQNYTRTHVYLHASVGLSSCFIVGYLVSLLSSQSDEKIRGLTYFTRDLSQND
jgi:SSS family solute:Na+ symporter